jgi:hypothetical protein
MRLETKENGWYHVFAEEGRGLECEAVGSEPPGSPIITS